MSVMKQLGFGLLTTSVLSAGCKSMQQGLRNPAIIAITQADYSDQLRCADFIANLEQKTPKGFTVHNRHFVESKNRYHTPAGVTMTIGYNLADSTVYLKGVDRRQHSLDASATCNERTIVPLGHCKDMTSDIQEWCVKAQKAIAASGVKKTMEGFRLREIEENVVDIRQEMGGGFTREVEVNLNKEKMKLKGCFKDYKMAYDANFAHMAKRFAQQNTSHSRRYQSLAANK